MAKNKAKTDPDTYRCDVCGVTFKTKDELKEHARKLHPDMGSERQPESKGSASGLGSSKR